MVNYAIHKTTHHFIGFYCNVNQYKMHTDPLKTVYDTQFVIYMVKSFNLDTFLTN